ncbi:hypothetical protein NDU88_003307 [Pleurodeles waltl]|uniref:Uncharacterized protein n=1 Tax=Pleurodeles waltl TaxID=8319 RepID=A0AAV7QEJ5_PLEWA|nr:hypothetical protein NDU88_003307 [Pleurodeles waltl]
MHLGDGADARRPEGFTAWILQGNDQVPLPQHLVFDKRLDPKSCERRGRSAPPPPSARCYHLFEVTGCFQ